MNIAGILLVITVSAVAHAATVRYDGKVTDSKKSQGQAEFQATKPSVVETSSRSSQEDMHLAQLKMQTNQIENSRIHDINKFAYQSQTPTSQAFHSQDHFATDSSVSQDFHRDQSMFHSQQSGVPVTTVSALQSQQNDQYNSEFSYQPESYNDQPSGLNQQQFYNMEQQQQFYNDKDQSSDEPQFFNNQQQTPDQDQFYSNRPSEEQFFYNRQQEPIQEQFYNDKQKSQEPFYQVNQKSQEQFYNDKQKSQEQVYNDKQKPQEQFFNDKQKPQEQFFNDKQKPQEQFFNDKQKPQEQFFNDKQKSQDPFYNDKQQPQEQQQIFNTMHVVGVDQRFNNNNKPFQGISNQQSTQIHTGKHSTQIQTQGVVQLSAFDNREQPIVLPHGAVQSASVLVSGLKNLPILPAMVYNAGSVPSPHAVAFSSNPLYKGAAVRQHMQTPYVRYVYGHIL